MLAGENIGSRFVVPTVASSVDLVVHIGLDERGRRTVREVAAVSGRVENDIVEAEPVFAVRDGDLRRMSGVPARRSGYEQAGLDLDRLLDAAEVA